LMDISLQSERDDFEIAQRIQNVLAIPMVLLTAGDDQTAKYFGRITGSFRILNKPFDPEQLLATIELSLSASSLVTRLRESEERWHALVDCSPDQFMMLDTDLLIQYINRPSPGLKQEDLIGTPIYALAPADQQTEIRAIYEHVMKTSQSARYETTFYPQTGDPIFYEIRVVSRKKDDRNIGFTINSRDITRKKILEQELVRLIKELGHSNEQSKIFHRRISDAQEKERKYLSRELHDELGQALTAIALELAMIEKELPLAIESKIKERLAGLKMLVDEVDESVSEIALDLRPSMLDDLGLLPTLRWYVNRFTRRTNIEVEMNVSGLEERLPQELATTLYRVSQEALTNISKHAQADKIIITLEFQELSITLNIEDDGRGFDVEKATTQEVQVKNLGLLGMAERVSALEGFLEIQSQPEQGTRLSIEIPRVHRGQA
jgi:PAS domain S-box-containing protein